MLRSRKIAQVLMGAVVVIAAGQSSAWALPDDRVVEYRMHATPGDPQTAVVFKVVLVLLADSQDGDSVGWDIKEIQFIENPGEHDERSWSKSDPNGTALWWIEHDDPDDPTSDEFDNPPLMSGIAAADNPSDPDLEFDFDAYAYAPPPNLGVPAASTTYEAVEETTSQVVREGADETVTLASWAY